KLGITQPALRVRKEQGDQPAALACQPARQRMWLVAKFLDRVEDSLARRLGNGARSVQRVGHGAHSDARAAGYIGHGGHGQALSAASIYNTACKVIETYSRSASIIVPQIAAACQAVTRRFRRDGAA